MHIVIAPDSYKGSLSAVQVATTMKKAILTINAQAKVTIKPMADGGEGTLDALLTAMEGERINLTCTGPLGIKIKTSYAIIDSTTALIEYAMIAGLTQVPHEQRNPDITTSYGIGEIIIDALDRGCSSFIIGIGGSATNDGGLGMLTALGMKAWDKAGNLVGIYGRDVLTIDKVSFEHIDPRLQHVSLKIASDVNNPLCGKNGATVIYGPQKGATETQVNAYDHALLQYGHAVESTVSTSLITKSGAGAAGGLGFALLSIGATLVSGAELIAETIRLEDAIKQSDLVLTGEGNSNEQTLFGKAPHYVSTLAKQYSIPTLLVSGSLTGDLDALRKSFSGCFSILTAPSSLEESMENAEQLLFEKTKLITHFLLSL